MILHRFVSIDSIVASFPVQLRRKGYNVQERRKIVKGDPIPETLHCSSPLLQFIFFIAPSFVHSVLRPVSQSVRATQKALSNLHALEVIPIYGAYLSASFVSSVPRSESTNDDGW